MEKKEKKVILKRITLDIPRDLYKEVHIAILHKYDCIYGHLREAFIEGLKMWLEKQKVST